MEPLALGLFKNLHTPCALLYNNYVDGEAVILTVLPHYSFTRIVNTIVFLKTIRSSMIIRPPFSRKVEFESPGTLSPDFSLATPSLSLVKLDPFNVARLYLLKTKQRCFISGG
jgi:hypothetical protein